jgi:transcription-repair coupling factor (superfamily II helicase)
MLAAEVKKLRRAMTAVAEGKVEGELPVALIPSGGPFSAFEEELKEPVTVDLPLAIGIPADYIHNQDLRLRIYRRIATIRDEDELEPLIAEFSDRFGPLPEMFQNLFYQMRVKLRADAAGLTSVSTESGQIVLRYPALTENMGQRMLNDLGSAVRGGKNAYWCSFLKDDEWQERLLDVLDILKRRVVDVVVDAKFLPG